MSILEYFRWNEYIIYNDIVIAIFKFLYASASYYNAEILHIPQVFFQQFLHFMEL